MLIAIVVIGAVVVWYVLRARAEEDSSSRRLRAVQSMRTDEPGMATLNFTITTTASTDEPEAQAADFDAWEGTFWEVSDPVAVNARLRLKYTDGNGKLSERDVSVRQFGEYGPTGLIIGHCSLRDATRTFRIDRIREATDLETGEVLTDVADFLRAEYRKSPAFSLDSIVSEHFDVIRSLLYVGKADGQLRAPERRVIAAACRELTGDDRITDDAVRDLLDSLEVPSVNAFKQAVGRIAKKGTPPMQQVLKVCEDIVATQKTVHHSEAEALAYIKSRTGSLAAEGGES